MAYNHIIHANCLDPLAGLPSMPDACAVLEYVELARKRVRAVETGVTMAERKRGQKGLFESEEGST